MLPTMTILLSILVLIISFFGLHKVTDNHFVPSLNEITSRLRITSDVAGATFMAIGSSAPELFISLLALVKGTNFGNLGAGTIVGSAIFNLLVIVGGSAIIRNAVLTWQPVVRDLMFYSLTIVLLYWVLRDGTITLSESFYFLIFYIGYLFFLPLWRKIFPYQEPDPQPPSKQTNTGNRFNRTKATYLKLTHPIDRLLAFFMPDLNKKPHLFMVAFILSVAIITFISWLLVEAGITLAQSLGMSYLLIGITVLAIGSSIPDLLGSIIVARQGKGDMAVSNAIGSNIFDILVGLGVVWMIMIFLRGETIPISQDKLDNSIIILMASVAVLLSLIILSKWRIGRGLGLFLIFLYLFYLGAAISGYL